jgi:hypothetical protein
MRQDDFQNCVEERIRKQLGFPENVFGISELTYKNHAELIQRILLLFNIESILHNPDQHEFYPFRLHKAKKWSLEHIHAQNSQELRTEKEWVDWLNYHKPFVERIANDPTEPKQKQAKELLKKLISIMKTLPITREIFNDIAIGIAALLSYNPDDDSMHRISNLALLGKNDNSALNNSVYAVKRQMIIDFDKNGNYIPICTRRAFFKYYTPESVGSSFYFWSDEDKKCYEKEIENVLANYLSQQEEI